MTLFSLKLTATRPISWSFLTRATWVREVFGFRYVLKPWLAYVLLGIGVPATLFFHFYERSMGFWSSPSLRFFSCALLLAYVPVMRYVKSQPIQVVAWESIVFLFFPVFSSWLMLMNSANTYWYSTYILGGVFLGFCTKWYLIPLHYGVGAVGATWVHQHLLHFDKNVYAQAWTAQGAAVLATVAGNGIIIALEYGFRKAKEVDELRYLKEKEQMRAEEAEKRAVLEATAGAELAKLNAKQRETIEVLKSYTRPSLVAYIQKEMDPRTVLPSQKHFTVLNCDLRDFTGLTERMEPQDQIKLLNSYFSMMTDAVEKHEGEMDKFIGDAFMALFMDPAKAGFAAMDCRRALQNYNKTMLRTIPNFQLIQNGTGIARGLVTHGNIGSLKKLDLTVVGAAANISARLEALTKKYNVDILVTEDIVKSMGNYPHCRWVDQVKVRGSKQGLRIYELYGHQAPVVVEYKDATKEILEKALRIYFQRGFRDAERLFSALLEKSPPHLYLPQQPMDRIYLFYLMRCERNRIDVNTYERMLQDWDGFHEFAE